MEPNIYLVFFLWYIGQGVGGILIARRLTHSPFRSKAGAPRQEKGIHEKLSPPKDYPLGGSRTRDLCLQGTYLHPFQFLPLEQTFFLFFKNLMENELIFKSWWSDSSYYVPQY